MSNDLFAPPREDELKHKGDLFSPPQSYEVEEYTASDNPPYRELKKEEVPYEQQFEDAYNLVSPQDVSKLSTTQPESTWSKFKDLMASAGTGFTEGATANKTAEILSRVLPIKTDTKQIQSIIDRQHKANPGSYFGGELAGMAISPLSKLGLPAYSAISGAEGDTWKEKGIGAGVGGVLGTILQYGMNDAIKKYGPPMVPKLVENTGKAMQLPQQAMESVLEPIGAIAAKLPFLSKYLESAGKSKSGTALFSDSQKIKELKNIEDAAALSEMGGKTANAIKSTEREITEKLNSDQSVGGKLTNAVTDFLGGDALNKTYGTLSDPEKAVVMASMANGFKQRGLNTDPVALKATFEDMAKNSGIDLNDTSIRDVVRTLNRRDPAWAVNSFKNVSNFFGPLLERTGNVTPEYFEAQMSVDKLHGMLKQNSINRMMQTDGANIGKGWIPTKQVNQYAQDASRLYPDLGSMSSTETTNVASMRGAQQQTQKQAQQKVKEQVQMIKPWLGDATDESIKKYTGKEVTDQGALQEAGALASGRLRNIQSGQAVANLVAGGFQGGSILSHHGFPGVESFLSMAPQATSWASKAGQAIEKKGAAMTPDNFASQFLTNPSIIAQMSQAPGITGQMGQYLNKGMESMGIDGVKSRLFTSMTNPTFREEILKMMGNTEDNKPEMTKNLNR